MSTFSAVPLWSDDRFGRALFLSGLLHVTVVLGVSFKSTETRSRTPEVLEITLVPTHSRKTPRNPDFLAQANQEGGGNVRDHRHTQSPVPAMELHRQIARIPTTPRNPPAGHDRKNPPRVLVAPRLDSTRGLVPPDQDAKRRSDRHEPEVPGRVAADKPERARLLAELDRNFEEWQKLPRHKYVHARTREYKYATYMEEWRARIERIGNLNYPGSAQTLAQGGSLVLDVAVGRNGEVTGLHFHRSSGHTELDQAARRIVELAAPFPPLPPEIRAETDVLHITRTWLFRATGELETH